MRRAKRSTAEAPAAGKDEVISGCHNEKIHPINTLASSEKTLRTTYTRHLKSIHFLWS